MSTAGMEHTEPIIGLHMIVRDEEELIGRALRSLLPGVDRIAVLDTGSRDGTLDAIRAALEGWGGEFILDTAEWPADFGAARQRSLDLLLRSFPDVTHVTWADADDVVMGAEFLRSWAARLIPGAAAGFVAHYAYGHDAAGNLACSHYRERLIPTENVGSWTGAIHETLGHAALPLTALPAPLSTKLPADAQWPRAADGVEWVHAPVAGEPGRNRAILERQVEEGEATARTWFYLASELAVAGDLALHSGEEDAEAQHRALYEQAADALERYDDEAPVWTDESYQAMCRRADFVRVLGRHREALELNLRAAEKQPDWPDAWHGAARSYLALDLPRLALDYTKLGQTRPYPHTPMILNPTDYTIGPARLTVAAHLALGEVREAAAAARHLAALNPGDPHSARVVMEAEEAGNRAAAKEALLALDEALARHDENLSALAVLQAAPYFLRNDPDVADRLLRRHQGMRHVLGEPDRLRRFYGTDNPHVPLHLALGVGEDDDMREAITAFCGALPRAQFLLAGLREQMEEAGLADLSLFRVLDLGCNDAWIGWWLVAEHGLGGYQGVDLNDRALAYAADLSRWYPPEVAATVGLTRADILSYVPDDRFEAVVCYEVIEHVPDIHRLARHLASCATPDGRVYVSTPDGAYERGNVQDWNDPEPRGHVRAMRPQDLSALALDEGILRGLHASADGVVVASWTPRPRVGRLDLYLGSAGGPWHPRDATTTGMGGSETMAVRAACAMADRGWRVRVYGNCSPAAFGGAEFLPWWTFLPGDERDVLVSSRHPSLIDQDPRGRRILWLHDAEYPGQEHLIARWEEVWFVGEWQRDEFAKRLEDPVEARVMPNGIPVAAWPAGERGFAERDPAVIYSSSPDRGLDLLLDLWPEVLDEYDALAGELAPPPQLRIAYGFTPTYEAMAQVNPALQDLRRRIEDRLSLPGVRWLGQIGQDRLRKEQQECRVWAYPTDFPEVSCITAMEAQAAGLAVLTTNSAELTRTAGPAQVGRFPVAAKWTAADRRRYVRELARLLVVQENWQAYHDRSILQRARFDLSHVGELWRAALLENVPSLADTVSDSPDPRSALAWTP